MKTATGLMDQLLGVLPVPLHRHQAQRLVRELSKVQLLAHLLPFPRQEIGWRRKVNETK